jgi:endothelin-converting enzyme/putative endopeptidase
LLNRLTGARPALAAGLLAFAGPAAGPALAGIDLAGMNRAAVPGDDFYGLANGTWLATTEIPADRGGWSSGAVLAEDTNRRLVALLEDAARNRSTATPAGRMAADFYTAYLDEAGIESRDLAPLQPLLRKIAAIGDKAALARALGESLRADVDPLNNTNFFTENLFGLWVAQGLDDPTHYNAYLLQGGLGMPDRAYYVTDSAHMETVRTAYRAHIATILKLGGVADAEARAAKIFALERELAQAHAAREVSEDVLKANNPWRREEFSARAPGMDWGAFFDGAKLARQPRFIVWHPGAITGAAALVGRLRMNGSRFMAPRCRAPRSSRRAGSGRSRRRTAAWATPSARFTSRNIFRPRARRARRRWSPTSSAPSTRASAGSTGWRRRQRSRRAPS